MYDEGRKEAEKEVNQHQVTNSSHQRILRRRKEWQEKQKARPKYFMA